MGETSSSSERRKVADFLKQFKKIQSIKSKKYKVVAWIDPWVDLSPASTSVQITLIVSSISISRNST